MILTFIQLSFLLRKSMQSEMWLNWALHITQLYNKCRKVKKPLVPAEVDSQPGEEEPADEEPKLGSKRKEEMPANVCSNMYPALLLALKNIDFGYVLQVRIHSKPMSNSFKLS